jgi:hypothetical protein
LKNIFFNLNSKSEVKMYRVLIGSSNVTRFYKPELYKDFSKYLVIKCTDIESFRACTTNLGEEDSEIVISVIENFLEKSARDEANTEGWATKMGEIFNRFAKIIKEASERMPKTKFVIAYPITRPKIKWYQGLFDDITQTFKESLEVMKLDNVTGLDAIPQGCQQFEEDQVHLTEASGQIFLEGLLTGAEKFFRAPFVQLDDDEDMNEPESKTDELEKRIAALENQARSRQDSDNLVFARLREEMDANSNKLKEDRIVITGITSKEAPPVDPGQKKLWIQKIVLDIFATLIPEFGGKIVFINQSKSNGHHIPLVEVKLDTRENAAALRKAFAEKKKSGLDLGRIFVSNSVNLATRVRVDILKALAKKVSDTSVSAHAVPFVSKPVMHVRHVDGGQGTRTYTYTDAVAKFGHLLKQVELGEAFRRAGNSFKGQLQQHFVVLKDQGQMPQYQQQQQQYQPRENRKRGREEDEDERSHASGSYPRRGGARGYSAKRAWRGGYGRK